jgi:hypothetical protein
VESNNVIIEDVNTKKNFFIDSYLICLAYLIIEAGRY